MDNVLLLDSLLQKVTEDFVISKEEQDQITELAQQLNLTNDDIVSKLQEHFLKHFQDEIARFAEDGRIDHSEMEVLEQHAAQLGISKEELEQKINEAVSQRRSEMKDELLSTFRGIGQASKLFVRNAVDVATEKVEDIQATEEYQKLSEFGQKAGEFIAKKAKVITGIQGLRDKKEAKSINDQANEIKSTVEAHTEELRKKLNDGLDGLGRVRLNALHNTVGRFIYCLKQMNQGAKAKEYEFLKEVDIDAGHIQEMEQIDMAASDALKVLGVGGSFAAVGVAATPAIVTGVVTSLCAASTGTAISTLSGAAASNAVLAWLGGGAVAAGGGGVAAGTVVLGAITGGVAIGAAVLAAGSLTSAFYSRKLTEATTYLAGVQEWEAKVKQSWVALEAMMNRIEEIKNVTIELERRASIRMSKLEAIYDIFDSANMDHVKVFQEAAIMAKSMSELSQTPIMDENGNLTEESALVASKTEKLLNSNL